MKTNKFIRFQVVVPLEDLEEDTTVVGFGEAVNTKKKRSRKKPEIVVTSALVPVSTITAIIKGDNGLTIVDTLDKTLQVTDDFELIAKKLGVRR